MASFDFNNNINNLNLKKVSENLDMQSLVSFDQLKSIGSLNTTFKLGDWGNLTNSCVVIIKGKDKDEKGEENQTGTLNDIDHLKILFQKMDTYLIREDKLTKQINLIIYINALSGTYKKIAIFYTGHSINSGDNFPIITLKDMPMSIYTLHKFCEQKFAFSVILTDSCNIASSRSGNKEVFTTLGKIKPLGEQELQTLFDNRGHLCISSSIKGQPAVGYKNLGGVFLSCFLAGLREHKAWVKAFRYAENKLSEYLPTQKPFYEGYILSEMLRYEEETLSIIKESKINSRERSDSEKKREEEYFKILGQIKKMEKGLFE